MLQKPPLSEVGSQFVSK